MTTTTRIHLTLSLSASHRSFVEIVAYAWVHRVRMLLDAYVKKDGLVPVVSFRMCATGENNLKSFIHFA